MSVKVHKSYLTLGLQVQDNFEDPKNLTTQCSADREELRTTRMNEQEQLEDLMELIKQAYTNI